MVSDLAAPLHVIDGLADARKLQTCFESRVNPFTMLCSLVPSRGIVAFPYVFRPATRSEQ